MKRLAREQMSMYLFVAPLLIWWLIFGLYPLIENYRITLYDTNSVLETGYYVGLGNFRRVITDPVFWRTFGNSFKYSIFQVPIQLSIALLLALTLNLPWVRAKSVLRTMFFVPCLMSMTLLGMVISLMLNPYDGVFNQILMKLHLISKPIDWLGDERYAFPTIIGLGIWQTLGFNLVYFLAALQSIPRELYEASEIDGVSGWHQLIYITLPLIAPVGLLILILAVIGSLNVFELVLVTTGGGPACSTEVVQTYIYKLAFASGANQQIGYATAAALFMSIMILGLTGLQILAVNRMRRTRRENGV
ncbi:MAG TPA: sugar ABC transporter permease [Firmicutes bacterium]|nr:sugar ABC transporter permease [Bacillota bacterium]